MVGLCLSAALSNVQLGIRNPGELERVANGHWAGEKEKPRPLSGFAIGASTWRVERSRFAPCQDPLKRNSHTLARSRLAGNDSSPKENHCDIFATTNPALWRGMGLP